MKFTMSWLKRFLDTEATVSEITFNLTKIGLEVEEVIDRTQEFKEFEVGYIVSAKAHPNADALRVCEVEYSGGILQIVCGAPNARAGIKVVLSKIGAIIPNGGFKIKQSHIRGVESCGMMCSASELLLSDEIDGIIELPGDAVIGESCLKYLGLDDPVIEINVTPNRGDALGVYGIARDLAASGIGKLKVFELPQISHGFKSNLKVEVKDVEACPAFMVREIRNIENKESPEWLKNLLINIGKKPVSTVVDVTNYICFTFGQPMHAYDANKLGRDLIVSKISATEKFTALNEKEYELESGDLVISSSGKVHALAGIIGGKNSSCDLNTSSIILEAACFNSVDITKVGRRLQIDSDSRYRFERKIDHMFSEKAMEYATDLILSICGGESSELILGGDKRIDAKIVEFDESSLTAITGLELKSSEICDILDRLGFMTAVNGRLINVTVPSWRHDITIKEDIAEEIARIYGYDKLPEIAFEINPSHHSKDRAQQRLFASKKSLVARGFNELVTWSFMSSKHAIHFAPLNEDLELINPISLDLNYMRPSIVPNLLQSVHKNLNRSIKDLAFFEIGPVFSGTGIDQEKTFISGIRTGKDICKNPHQHQRDVDVFDIKADVEVLMQVMGLSLDKCELKQDLSLDQQIHWYHPKRYAKIFLGKNLIGHFGQIHPKILDLFELDQDVMAFELDSSLIPLQRNKFGMRDEFVCSDFQATSRDYAFIVERNTPVDAIVRKIREVTASDKIKVFVDVFDVYQGIGIEDGKKSVALSVKINPQHKTLTDEDLNQISNSIVTSIEEKFKAKLRTIVN